MPAFSSQPKQSSAIRNLLVLISLIFATSSVATAQQASPTLPNRMLTPGDILPVTVADIRVPGYSKKVRNVPQNVKNKVYAEYGITNRQPREYEVDHLISLELGGSNSIKNLWPQSYLTQPWNAHVKDKLENKLHAMVVSGRLDLPTAQRMIATNWIAAYKKVFGTNQPVSKSRGSQSGTLAAAKRHHTPRQARTPAAANGVQVWVNLKSGVYHYPGERWYGNTKEGQYMSEDAARKAGYRATENGQ